MVQLAFSISADFMRIYLFQMFTAEIFIETNLNSYNYKG